MIKYDVGYSNKEINKVDVVSETKCFITIKKQGYDGTFYEDRLKKEGRIFDTFEDAKSFIIECHKRKVVQAEANLQSCKAMLKKVNDIPKPE